MRNISPFRFELYWLERDSLKSGWWCLEAAFPCEL
jgi:hypothetical protein